MLYYFIALQGIDICITTIIPRAGSLWPILDADLSDLFFVRFLVTRIVAVVISFVATDPI